MVSGVRYFHGPLFEAASKGAVRAAGKDLQKRSLTAEAVRAKRYGAEANRFECVTQLPSQVALTGTGVFCPLFWTRTGSGWTLAGKAVRCRFGAILVCKHLMLFEN